MDFTLNQNRYAEEFKYNETIEQKHFHFLLTEGAKIPQSSTWRSFHHHPPSSPYVKGHSCVHLSAD